jgi:hypothetical protein
MATTKPPRVDPTELCSVMAAACITSSDDDAVAAAYRRWLSKGFIMRINGHSFLEEMLLDWMRHVKLRIKEWHQDEKKSVRKG